MLYKNGKHYGKNIGGNIIFYKIAKKNVNKNVHNIHSFLDNYRYLISVTKKKLNILIKY